MAIVNPRLRVMEKFIQSHFVDKIGKENFFLSVDDAVDACQFMLHKSTQNGNVSTDQPIVNDGDL